jgi:hypothetical protein
MIHSDKAEIKQDVSCIGLYVYFALQNLLGESEHTKNGNTGKFKQDKNK